MKKVINIRPVLLVSLGFLSGILFAYFNFMYKTTYAFAALAVILALLPTLFLRGKRVKAAVLAVCVTSALILGLFSFNVKMNAFINSAVDAKEYIIEGTVKSIGYYGDSAVITSARLSGKRLKYNINLKITGKSDLRAGDKIELSAKVYSYADNGDSEQLALYALYKTAYTVYANGGEIVNYGRGGNLFLNMSGRISSLLTDKMSESGAGFALALLIGDTGNMEFDMLQNFRYGGIAHVFSVSGLHIAILAAFLMFLLKKVQIKRIFKAIIITVVLFLYSGICGFSPPSVRAAVMCGMALVITSLGGKTDSLNALAASLIAVLAISPFYIISVGFQLSFTVVLSMILLGNPVMRLLKKCPRKLASPLSVVIPAQLGSMPILLDAFGYISAAGLLLNLVFVPLLSGLFIILFFFVLVCLIFPFLGAAMAVPDLLLKLTAAVINFADYSKLIISGFSLGAAMLLYYAAIFVLSDKLNVSGRTKGALSAVFLTALAAVVICL